MNKAELVSAMAKDAGITKGQAERALNCTYEQDDSAVRSHQPSRLHAILGGRRHPQG